MLQLLLVEARRDHFAEVDNGYKFYWGGAADEGLNWQARDAKLKSLSPDSLHCIRCGEAPKAGEYVLLGLLDGEASMLLHWGCSKKGG